MELILNNFEVLDQTQMQEIDADGTYGNILKGCSYVATICGAFGGPTAVPFTIVGVVLSLEADYFNSRGW